MRLVSAALALALLAAPSYAQTKPPVRRPAPARKAPAAKPAAPKPPAPAPVTRVPATFVCPSELGIGIATKRRFCDVLTGASPADGIVVTVPPHQGVATISFELHNRHTYSAELVRAKTAYREYTATVGVLTMDNTLVSRAIIDSEFRTEKDLLDRISGGAGAPVKAVAPTGSEFVQIALPDGASEVAILGEKLSIVRPDGTELLTSPGRPVATVSNVMIEYRPAPPPRVPTKKKQ